MMKTVVHTLCAAAVLAGAGIGSAAADAQWEDPARVRAVAEAFAAALAGGSDISATATGIDDRLRLPLCDEAPTAFAPSGSRPRTAVTIGVRCGAAQGWTLYVPVRLTATRPVVVLGRPVNSGQTLTADTLSMAPRDITALGQGFYTDIAAVVGLKANRTLLPGTAVTPRDVDIPPVVRRGQTVTLLTRSSGIEIRARGEALSDGAADALVQVRNLSSGRVVRGIATAPGVVEIQG